jgi:hypothetical protein
MTEATNSVHLAKLRASMSMATRVLALQAATDATKRELQAHGKKVAHMPRRDLRSLAEAYLQDHQEALLAEASLVVERWRLEGKFGKRAALNTDAQKGKA